MNRSMTSNELNEWFANLQEMLEPSYLAAAEPWQQSGFSGPFERWVACRRPIAECMTASGTFLDIGCANGYLLESAVKWAGANGVQIDPWGVDISEKLVAMAKDRLVDHTEKLFVGNGLTWQPPQKFDYVRTELGYVPEDYQHSYVSRLLDQYLRPEGKLLVPEYRSRKESSAGPWVDDILGGLGFTVDTCESGFWDGKELTRVAVVRRG